MRIKIKKLLCALFLALLCMPAGLAHAQVTVQNPQNGGIGMEGTINVQPPTVGATISIPTTGQVFTNIPITVSGLCPTDLLVKLFRNNVFAGSTVCQNGSWSITTDLFVGQNDLIAKVYDALDQPGPNSNTVTVTYNEPVETVGSRITLTSNYAQRGANPGEELTWPINISGGSAPYAISVDWGDGTTPSLISQPLAGELVLKHFYDRPGIYKVIIKATDRDGQAAYLQVVGVGNGDLSQSGDTSAPPQIVKVRVLWEPAVLLFIFMLIAFWLGNRSAIKRLRSRMERGLPPFKR